MWLCQTTFRDGVCLCRLSSSQETALVCLGDRKREVEFGEGSNEAFNSRVFRCAIYGNEKIIFQLKREDWAGEFIDMVAGSPVPDRSVLRAVVVEKGGPSEEVSYMIVHIINYTSSV